MEFLQNESNYFKQSAGIEDAYKPNTSHLEIKDLAHM